ncbi:MAG: acyloxyacyl hydrolase [Blastocatellia bacterium]|nr:acyloxyacyl hydrolase [Blastocatellia bacterium]
MKKIAVSVAWLMLAAFVISAQDEEPGKNELSVWGGFAPAVRTFDTGGRTWDATLGIGAIRYSRRFNNSDWINLKYTLDASVVVMNYPDKVVTGTTVTPVRETRYGFGVAPIGVQGNFRPRKKLQPFIGLSLGFLPFTETTPNVTGKKLNFSTEGGGGIEYRLKNKKAITFGYKFYHISNASRGIENPGYDAQILYLGYTFSSK